MSVEDMRRFLDITKMEGGFGKSSTALINVIRGMNHRGFGNLVPANTDEQGFTFFTKPNLNLSYDNVINSRRLHFLTDDKPNSMATAIRCMLSPMVGAPVMPEEGWAYSYADDPMNDPTNKITDTIRLPRSIIVDDRYPFIPLLSNTLLSLSGWPDFVLESFNSKEGLRKEVTSWVDSIGDIYSAFDLTANFHNLDGDPVTTLFAVWTEYAARVAEGSMDPYMNMIVEHEIDYQTRIYRFIMDPTRTYIRKIADCGAAYPTAVPNGAAFNYTSENIRIEDTKEVSIRFNCVGARYNDPITIYNFNTLVGIFNSDMRDTKIREERMVKLDNKYKRLFNYRGYPRIDETNELEWWVPKHEFEAVVKAGTDYPVPAFRDATGTIKDSEGKDVISTVLDIGKGLLS